MRKSASEIINDLETRVANLEKEAIFGLFKPKTLKEQNEARLRKEQKQQRSEEAALNKLKAQALKARTKAVSKVNEKFLKSVQYEIYKSPSVDNVDVSLNRGRMVGVISVGGFEYEIESSLGKVSFMMPDEYVMRKDLNNFRVTEGKFIISGLGLRSDAVITYNISDYADDVSYVVREILKVLVKASNVAHSDKAVSDRAEAKRMRKEKYRLANRRQASYSSSLDLRLLEKSREGYTSLTTKALMRLNEHEMNVDSTDESPLGARQGVIEFEEMIGLLDKRSRSRAEDKLLLDYANEVVRQFGNLGIV